MINLLILALERQKEKKNGRETGGRDSQRERKYGCMFMPVAHFILNFENLHLSYRKYLQILSYVGFELGEDG